MLSISKENFLKAIYHHKEKHDRHVTSSHLAEDLKISQAAVSEMSKKLAKRGLLTHQKYKGVDLTPAGEIIALKVVRRHRLWELFLIKSLKLPLSQVHIEAERLEHATSEFLLDKLDAFLDYPQFGPHGDPIPDKNGKLPVMPKLSALHTADTGKQYRVMRLDDTNRHLIEYFEEIGVELHAVITVTKKLDYDQSMTVTIDGHNHLLTDKMAKNIFVTPNTNHHD